MFVKLYDGTPHVAKMSDEEAIKAGYKPAVFTAKPEVPEGHRLGSVWEEHTDSIAQVWFTEIMPEEGGEASAEEIVNILTGGAS